MERIAVVTGATSGIGKVTARELARQGFRVVLVARDAEKAARTASEIAVAAPGAKVETLLCDMTSQKQIRAAAEKGRRDLAEVFTRIGDVALPADHTAARRVSRSIGHIEYHFEKLAERATRALVRKDRERWSAARELVATLHPDRHVQDRVARWFAYWRELGNHFVERLSEEV